MTLACQTAHAMNQWGEVWVALSLITQSLPSSFYHFFLLLCFILFFQLHTESVVPCLTPPPPTHFSLCISFFNPQLSLRDSKRCEKVEMYVCMCVRVCVRSLVAFSLTHSYIFPWDISFVKRLVNLKVKLIHPPIVCLFVLEISERALNTGVKKKRTSRTMCFMVGS